MDRLEQINILFDNIEKRLKKENLDIEIFTQIYPESIKFIVPKGFKHTSKYKKIVLEEVAKIKEQYGLKEAS